MTQLPGHQRIFQCLNRRRHLAKTLAVWHQININTLVAHCQLKAIETPAVKRDGDQFELTFDLTNGASNPSVFDDFSRNDRQIFLTRPLRIWSAIAVLAQA